MLNPTGYSPRIHVCIDGELDDKGPVDRQEVGAIGGHGILLCYSLRRCDMAYALYAEHSAHRDSSPEEVLKKF
jgi:hypothetical protein